MKVSGVCYVAELQMCLRQASKGGQACFIPQSTVNTAPGYTSHLFIMVHSCSQLKLRIEGTFPPCHKYARSLTRLLHHPPSQMDFFINLIAVHCGIAFSMCAALESGKRRWKATTAPHRKA